MTEILKMPDILEKMDAKTLSAIVKEVNILKTWSPENIPEEFNKRYLDKEACLKLITMELKKQMVKQLVLNLYVKELKAWAQLIPTNVLTSKNLNNENSATVIKKRLREQIDKVGLEKYMKKLNPTKKLLRATLKTLGVMTDKDTDGEKLTQALMQQLKVLALDCVLQELSIKILQQMVVDSNLNIKTSSKNIIVYHLLEMKDYVPEPRKRVYEKRPKAAKEVKPDGEKTTTKRKPRLNQLELVFDSDDSEEFDVEKYKKREKEVKINPDDDADLYYDYASDFELSKDEKEKDKKKEGKKKKKKKEEESDPEFDVRKKEKKRERRSKRSRRSRERSRKYKGKPKKKND